MKKFTLTLLTVVLAGTISYAGEKPEVVPAGKGIGLRERPGMGAGADKWQGGGREFMRGLQARGFGLGGGIGNYIERLTKDPELAKRIGITEDQLQKVKQAIEPIEVKRKELEEQREKAAAEQAELLAKDSVDEEALLAVVEKLGQINTELAKLSIKELIAVKGVFTPEQIAEIRKNIRAEVEKRFGEIRERMKEGKGEGWRGEKGKEEKPWKEWKRGEEPLRHHREGGGPVRGDI
jgi:Spy/CpxP family protein refolding chaperone